MNYQDAARELRALRRELLLHHVERKLLRENLNDPVWQFVQRSGALTPKVRWDLEKLTRKRAEAKVASYFRLEDEFRRLRKAGILQAEDEPTPLVP